MKDKMIFYFVKRTMMLGLLFVLGFSALSAQPKKRPAFDPKKFQAELEQYITTQACLTPEESAKFFPVYRQMMKKQRQIKKQLTRRQQMMKQKKLKKMLKRKKKKMQKRLKKIKRQHRNYKAKL